MADRDDGRSSIAVPGFDAVVEALRPLLADVFALYVKTKGFHWHVVGPHFRDYHLLFDEQAGELHAMVDAIAERARKLGGATIRSIGEIAKERRIADTERVHLDAAAMVAELLADNRRLAGWLREVHARCDEHGDIATASLIENWIDETERRAWFLVATAAVATKPTLRDVRPGPPTGLVPRPVP